MLLWIGVASIDVMGKVLITSYCIVGKFLGYGVLPLDCLVLLVFYSRRLLIYWKVGETGWESTLQIFGIWYLIV